MRKYILFTRDLIFAALMLTGLKVINSQKLEIILAWTMICVCGLGLGLLAGLLSGADIMTFVRTTATLLGGFILLMLLHIEPFYARDFWYFPIHFLMIIFVMTSCFAFGLFFLGGIKDLILGRLKIPLRKHK